MATKGNNDLTLADWAKRLDPDGKVPTIVELLSQKNEILEDMMWVEGNLPTGHRTTVRTGLPSVAWRMLNYGVPKGKSKTVQVDDQAGMLEAFAEVDKDLAMLNGNTNRFRLSETQAFLEAMSQEMALTTFYGNTDVDPEKFLGLAPRFDSLSADNAENIIDAGGTGSDNMSIWLVVWGENTCHGIFPKGSQAGLIHEDLGIDTVEDASGNKYRAYQDHYQWKAGLTLRDWRYVVRVANIDKSNLTKDASSGADLVDLMTQALERVQDLTSGTPVFYVNRDTRSYLRRQIRNANNVQISMDEVAGKRVMFFDEVPVRRCDALGISESQVT